MGKTAPWVRAFAALAEAWVRFPAPIWRLADIYNSSCRASDTLFRPPRAPGTHVMQMYTQAEQSYTYNS